MYVRLTTYDIDANYKKNAKYFAENFQRRLQNYDGFISVEYYYNLDLGIAKSLSKWKSKEQANKALKDFSDSLKLAAQSFGSGEYSTKVLKMYKVAA